MTLLSAAARVAPHDYTMTWLLVAVCLFACLLASAGAIIIAARLRRQREPHYRRHLHNS